MVAGQDDIGQRPEVGEVDGTGAELADDFRIVSQGHPADIESGLLLEIIDQPLELLMDNPGVFERQGGEADDRPRLGRRGAEVKRQAQGQIQQGGQERRPLTGLC